MDIRGATVDDLVAELLNRLSPETYRSHKHGLDTLAFRIGAEQQDADVRAGRYAHG